ncbi:hypothetical protein [Acidisphaera sp. S103]|uniref:hypothetical protein n=1 Tax=Acidisphaera sp. S103 TaxID=1747223 RepID=UPI00131D0113|nr:hypothetical protein [Acidisphaera sp. S103]
MPTLEEEAWRTGLKTKGRDWVLAELNMRPGLPQDPLYDVVFEPPYPSREFCQRWCVETDNQYLRLSGTGIATLVGLAILAIFVVMAMYSLSEVAPKQSPQALSHGVQE